MLRNHDPDLRGVVWTNGEVQVMPPLVVFGRVRVRGGGGRAA